MQYFFVLGNNPTLSIAEITAKFSCWSKIINSQLLIIDSQENIQAIEAIEKLGGTIKIGVVNSQIDKKDYGKILKNILQMLVKEKISGKFKFGVSCYGVKTIKGKVIGLDIKRYLKNKNISSRWVDSREATLSSVVVEQNKLIDRGMEIVLIGIDNKILIGQTLAVQPFKKLSFRDYGRPARDDRSGMLPPKLAQIMLNLSSANLEKTILDPFCGSGTILTEAMLMGYKNLIGADISLKAIENTKENIKWIKNNHQLQTANCKLFNVDAMQISKYIQPNSVDAIITEPYLGPQQSRFDISKAVKEIELLYSKSLMEFKKILKQKAILVMVWPLFYEKQKNIFINPNLIGFKIINPISENLKKNIFIKLTNRDTIIYGREQQKIWREIVVLSKE